MTLLSLRLRLAVLTLITITVALAATDFVLNARFTRYFQDRIYSELEQHLEQLTSNISLNASDEIEVAQMPDRRFEQPFSGLYWQVSVAQLQPLLSRSLWGADLSVPEGATPGAQFRTTAKSPTGSPVLVSGWGITLGEGSVQRHVVLAVAIDEAEVQRAATGFRSYLLKWLTVMLVFLILAAWVQISIGLAPLKVIRKKVEDVKIGRQNRLSGQFPSEVQPLVDEVNTLLETHEASLVAARAKAGDLAHGLKTPLTVIRAMMHELEPKIGAESAGEIQGQISAMHRFIERELAQVGQVGLQRRLVHAAPILIQMVSAMKKLPNGAKIEWQVEVPTDVTAPLDAHDLAELLGNILDNARKWAATRVLISGKTTGDGVREIVIEDDGKGVPADMYNKIISRGASLQNGSGLGLSIASDLMQSSGGTLRLEQSKMGGLKVVLSW